MRNLLPVLALGSWLSATSLANLVVHDASFTPDHVLRVTIGQIDSGCQTREDLVINGTSPGPVLHILPGATTWVRVYNDMADQNLTMHWHGIAQRLAPFADGTPLASQWPIPPGRFFDYEIVTDKDDAGSYYYHSHVEMQATSCVGTLIVDDCGQAPFQYDDERILMWQDWFADSSHSMRSPPQTDGLLLNGHGVPKGKTGIARKEGTKGKHAAPGQHGQSEDSQCKLPVIDVDPGKTYRFRFIGGTTLSLVGVAFECHSNLTIIQVDGSEYCQPASTSYMQVGIGQRFDVLFKTKTAQELKADGNRATYYIQMQTADTPNPFTGYAVLRYSQDAQLPSVPAKPVVNIPTGEATWNWMEYTLQPLYPDQSDFPSAEQVTRRVTVNVDLVSLPDGKMEFQFNGLSWTEASYTSPLLVDIYKRGEAAVPNYEAALKNGGWDPKTLAWPAKIGEVLEIIWQNTGAQAEHIKGRVESHPFHAHSKHFYDLGGGPGAYNADANNAKISQLGYKPIRRDTTLLYSWTQMTEPGAVSSWRGWRLRMTDAGVWMVHCHILTHMMMGMQAVWAVGNSTQIAKVPLVESQGYLNYGGDVYGSETHNPTYYEWTNEAANQCKPITQ